MPSLSLKFLFLKGHVYEIRSKSAIIGDLQLCLRNLSEEAGCYRLICRRGSRGGISEIPISLKTKRSLVDTFECCLPAEALQYGNDCSSVKKNLKIRMAFWHEYL